MVAEVVFSNVGAFGRGLEKIVATADMAGREIVTKGGLAIEAAAKAHMAGRPGPNVISGTLRRSVKVSAAERTGMGAWRSETGPTVIYGRRIELGFHGADSLGRVYNQPGYPYMAPGLADAGPVLAGIYTAAWRRAVAAQ